MMNMGGLWKKMPITAITFLLGLLALCGVMYFSGFYSKDAIIEGAYLTHKPVAYMLLAAAFLTAFYMGRLFFVAFMGSPNSKNSEKAHESPLTMTVPLGADRTSSGYSSEDGARLVSVVTQTFSDARRTYCVMGIRRAS